MDWNVKELTNETFHQEIADSPHPVFVDFWAAWCPPCRMMDPVIEALAEEFEGEILFRKLNTDFYKKISAGLDISGIPTYILFNEGREVWRGAGAMGKKKIVETLDRLK